MSRARLLLGLLAVAGCAAPPAAGSDGFRDRLLGSIPPGTRVDVPAAFGADGRSVAWVEKRDGASRAVCGSWTGPAFGTLC